MHRRYGYISSIVSSVDDPEYELVCKNDLLQQPLMNMKS